MRELSNWVDWKNKVPEELRPICLLCFEFYELINQMENYMPFLTGPDLERVQAKTTQIMAEYMKIMRKGILDKTKIQELQRDINKTLTPYFDTDGRVKPLTNEFRLARQEGIMDLHFPIFISAFTSFIDSRIGDCMSESKLLSLKYWTNQFISSSAEKGGIYPELKQEEGGYIQKLKRRDDF